MYRTALTLTEQKLCQILENLLSLSTLVLHNDKARSVSIWFWTLYIIFQLLLVLH